MTNASEQSKAWIVLKVSDVQVLVLLRFVYALPEVEDAHSTEKMPAAVVDAEVVRVLVQTFDEAVKSGEEIGHPKFNIPYINPRCTNEQNLPYSNSRVA